MIGLLLTGPAQALKNRLNVEERSSHIRRQCYDNYVFSAILAHFRPKSWRFFLETNVVLLSSSNLSQSRVL
jgi:hypothetical protein